MDYWRALEILNRRKWLILLSVVVTTLLTFVATRLVGSRWVARVTFVTTPAASSASTNPAEGPRTDITTSRAQASVYEAMVKSRDVLEPAIEKAGVPVPPDFLRNLKLEASGPGLYELQVSDSSPSRAEQLANSIAETFVDRNGKLYTVQAEAVVSLIETQIKEADAGLGAVRNRYDNYRRKHQILTNLNDQVSPALYQLQTSIQKRDDIQERLATARARLQEAEQELAALPATVPVQRPSASSPLAQQLEEQLAKVESQLVDLRSRYTDEKIEVRQALSTREALEGRLKAELAKQPESLSQQPNPALDPLRASVAELKREISGNEAQLAVLGNTIVRSQSRLKGFNGVETPLTMLAGEIAERTEARSNLSARLQNARMALDAARRQNPINVMSKANAFNPAVDITAGRTMKLVVLAALCALVGTASLVVAFDTLDRRVKTVREAEQALPAPVLTAVPQALGNVTTAALPRAAETHPLSLHAEAYHFLGMHLLSEKERKIRSLLVLSAKAEQGSTSTVANLGITLAQAGQRVVLVDANVRTPGLHHVFELRNDFGFTDLLAAPDEATLDVALQSTTVPNLKVLTSGSAVRNPWELFRSGGLHQLSRELDERADYVLYDTPSALAFPDAMNLASVVDAAYLCVRALEPLSGAEERLVQMLEKADVTVLGSVLNDIPASVLDSYENYQHYYPSANGTAPALSHGQQAGPVIVESGDGAWVNLPNGRPGTLVLDDDDDRA